MTNPNPKLVKHNASIQATKAKFIKEKSRVFTPLENARKVLGLEPQKATVATGKAAFVSLFNSK